MDQFSTIASFREYLALRRKQGLKVGFVPTMGALHEGHLDLVRRSLRENGVTACSIFVNPTQFNNPDDLANYPRTLAHDVRLLEETGCSVLFTPAVAEMYPEEEGPPVEVEFGLLDKVMEGRFRPGHFRGVVTVVKKFFDITEPDRAYFGKKDYQQLAVIRHMVSRLGLPVEIVPCETVREPDGLAMSSRNMRLTIAERQSAPVICRVLRKVKEKVGKVPVSELKEWAVKKMEETPGLRVEYFEIGDRDTLLPIDRWAHKDRAVAFVAAFLGDVRLIDNLELF